MAVVGTAGRHILIYKLENTPTEFKRIESPLKYQHRCVSIFKDKQNQPTGNRTSNFLNAYLNWWTLQHLCNSIANDL